MFPFPTGGSGRGSIALFVSKLFEVFTDDSLGRSSSYELRSDNCLAILDVDTFTSEVLPLFKYTTFKNFEKQLYLYDFLRLPPLDSDTQMIFSHESFRRGRPELLSNIKRKLKPSNQKGKSDEDNSPIATSSSSFGSRAASLIDQPRKATSSSDAMQFSIETNVVGVDAGDRHKSMPTSPASQRSVQELFNLQSKYLKSELYSIGMTMQKRLREQETEIHSLKGIIRALQKSRGNEQAASDGSISPQLCVSPTSSSDDVLQSFANLISMYAKPVPIELESTTTGPATPLEADTQAI